MVKTKMRICTEWICTNYVQTFEFLMINVSKSIMHFHLSEIAYEL